MADAPRRTDPRVLIGLAGVFLLARLAVAAASWGTNDAYTFYRFARSIDLHGLAGAYRAEAELNHPPIPALWAWAAYRLVGAQALPEPLRPPVVNVKAGVYN